jgi:hypothetical protein
VYFPVPHNCIWRAEDDVLAFSFHTGFWPVMRVPDVAGALPDGIEAPGTVLSRASELLEDGWRGGATRSLMLENLHATALSVRAPYRMVHACIEKARDIVAAIPLQAG